MQRWIFSFGLIIISLAVFLYAVIHAAPKSRGSTIWSQVMYGGENLLRGARGTGNDGASISMVMETHHEAGRLGAKIKFTHDGEVLTVKRSYKRDDCMRVRYATETRSMEIAARRDLKTSELIVVYTLSDGSVYTMWTDPEGVIKEGNIAGLRRLVNIGAGIPELVRHYLESKFPLRKKVPGSSEEFLFDTEDTACEFSEYEYCEAICKWECTHGSCNICQAVCRTGHQIGCEP
jgi:hypothetical protein